MQWIVLQKLVSCVCQSIWSQIQRICYMLAARYKISKQSIATDNNLYTELQQFDPLACPDLPAIHFALPNHHLSADNGDAF